MLLLAIPGVLVAHEAPAVTTVILVRHAEKAAEGGMEADPPLSKAGVARAAELARVLGGAKIDAIYTTPYERTRRTAAPIAAQLGMTATEIKAGKTYAEEMAKIIRDRHAGQTVLIVGHSNTTAQVIGALGIAAPPKIVDSQYDDLFVVTLTGGSATLLPLRYGTVAR